MQNENPSNPGSTEPPAQSQLRRSTRDTTKFLYANDKPAAPISPAERELLSQPRPRAGDTAAGVGNQGSAPSESRRWERTPVLLPGWSTGTLTRPLP